MPHASGVSTLNSEQIVYKIVTPGRDGDTSLGPEETMTNSSTHEMSGSLRRTQNDPTFYVSIQLAQTMVLHLQPA